MQQPFLLAELTEIERHIGECEQRLLRQREIVNQLGRHGRRRSQTVKIANEVLQSLEFAQSTHLNYRARLLQALRKIGSQEGAHAGTAPGGLQASAARTRKR
jgi:hypothetical protein